MGKFNMAIVDKVMKDVVLYGDMHDRSIVYAEYPKPSGAIWLSEIRAQDFIAFLRLEYSELANDDDELPVERVLRRITDEALHYEEHKPIEVYHRVAGNLSSGIEYFLADSMHQTVCITPIGQTVSASKIYKFVKRAGTLTQATPSKSQKTIFELLQPFVNLSDDNFTLFVIWLIQAFSNGTHYCLFLSAERGSGKSLLTHIIGELIDPSPSEKCLLPNSQDDLETLLAAHYLCCFDNVSLIPRTYSDVFCSAVTGGSVARRQKFFDKDLIYLPLHNVIVINGIGITPAESDLAERSLFFPLKKLTSKVLKPQSELEGTFQIVKPEILGCIFNILSSAMKTIDSIEPQNPPRMADAYKEMLAIADVLGISEDEFERMLAENTQTMDKARAVNPIVEAVCEFMEKIGKRRFEGSSTEVFNAIRNSYSGSKGLLPANAASFSQKLNQLDAPLKAAGYRFIIDDTGVRNNRITIIKPKT